MTNFKLHNTFLVTFSVFLCSSVNATEVLSIDCAVSGLNIYNQKVEKKIAEKLIHESGETSGGFKFSKTDFFSDDKKVDAQVISKTDSSLLSAVSMAHGKGYARKVYLLSNFYDFEAKEVTRVVVTLPTGELEKTTGKCNLKIQKK